LIAFGAASAAATFVAFLAGCIAVVIVVGGNHTYEILGAPSIVKDESLLQSFLLVGGTAANAAAAVSVFSILAIAWPAYVAVTHAVQNVSVWHCIIAGLLTAIIAALIVIFAQSKLAPLPSVSIYLYELASMIAAGFVAALVFWTIRFRLLSN
jgi:hypothetical protein